MLYDKYKAKVQKIAKALGVIKRFRVLIISVLVFVTATVTGLLATRGIVYGGESGALEIVYGTELECDAKAFMGSTYYEFYDPATGVWSQNFPAAPGTYKIRATAKATFGKRHGEEREFIVNKKTITLKVAESRLVYGDTPTLQAEFAAGDSATSNFEYTGLLTDNVQVTPIQSSVRILNAEGKDVTAFYTVSVEQTSITFDRRAVTFATNSAQKIYDGTPLTAQGYELTGGTLGSVNGRTDIVTFNCETSAIDGGSSVANEAEFTIYNPDGLNVTEYYALSHNWGTLTVNKRPITVKTGSKEQIYNGEAWYFEEYELDETQLAAGEYISSVENATGIIDVEEKANKFEVTLSNGYQDVTQNYDISYEYGTLKVTPLAVGFTSKGASSKYTAEPLRNENCFISSGMLAGTDEFEATFTGEIVHKGTAENTFTVTMRNIENGRDTTGNYAITYDGYGTLEILTSPLAFTTWSAEKYYDGTPLTAEGFDITEGELFAGDTLVLENYASIWRFTATQNTAEYKVLSADGADVTADYEFIQTNWGTLSIIRRPVAVQVVDHSKIYDGTPLTSNEVVLLDTPPTSDETTVLELSEGHTVTAELVGSITNVGTAENCLLDTDTVNFTFNGEDVTVCFEITEVFNGYLTVGKRSILIRTHDCSWTYDGDPHYDGDGMGDTYAYSSADVILEAENDYYLSLVEGHVITIEEGSQSSITNVLYEWESCENFLALQISDANGDPSIRDNYAIDYVYGALSITPRPITLRSGSALAVYNAQPLQAQTLTVEQGNLVKDHEAVGSDFASVIDVAKDVENTYSYAIFSPQAGEDVTHNYEVEALYGALTVAHRNVMLYTHDRSWEYDGYLHHDDSSYDSSEAIVINLPTQTDITKLLYPLVDNHTVITDESTATTVRDVTGEHTVENKIQFIFLDEYGNDVTRNYINHGEYGVLEITPRYLHIQTHTHEWIYNGKEQWDSHRDDLMNGYSNADLLFTKAEHTYLADNEYLVPNEAGATHLTTVFPVENAWADNIVTFSVYALENGIPRETTGNYVFDEYTYGRVRILPRPITLHSDSADKIYDGQPLTAHGYMITDGSLAEAQNVTLTFTGSQTNAYTDENEEYGESANSYTYVITNAKGEDVTVNYAVTALEGTLTVYKRPLTVAAKSDSKVYDGIPLEISDGQWELMGDYAPVDGHILDVKTSGCAATEAGDYVHEIYGDTACVNADGEDVTKNYAIETRNGALTIFKRNILIKTHDHTWEYDGYTHYDEDVYTGEDLYLSKGSCYTLLENLGHRLEKLSYTEITNVETLKNIMEFRVVYEDGTENTNYIINYEYGTLEITPRALSIRTYDRSKIYDGIALNDDRWTIEAGTVADNQTLEVQMTGSQTNAYTDENSECGESENSFIATVCDRNGVDVTYNYDITPLLGTLTVYKRNVHIQTHSSTWEYDGMEHYHGDIYDTNAEYFYEDTQNERILVNGEEIECLTVLQQHTIKPFGVTMIRNVSESGKENVAEFKIYDGDEDASLNYTIYSVRYGTLTITPRALTVLSASAERIYDGEPLTAHDYEITDGSLATNQRIELEFTGSQTNAYTDENEEYGESENTYSIAIFDQNDEEVELENYDLTLLYGTLTVYKREITIEAKSDSKVYDGTPLEMPEGSWDITSEYKLASGQSLSVKTQGNSITNVGTVTHAIVPDSAVITAGEEDVTRNYIITYADGLLEIFHRTIYINTQTYEPWIYDGEPHWDTHEYTGDDLFILEDQYYSLVEGHSLKRLSYTEIENVGEILNEMEFIVTYEDGTPNDNYIIEYMQTYLEVLPRPLTIQTGSNEKIYDGEPLVSEEWSLTEGEVVAGQSLTVKVTGSQTNAYTAEDDRVGVSENTFDWSITENGEDMSGNYDVTPVCGTLTVTKRPVYVKTGSRSWTYNGVEHYDDTQYSETVCKKDGVSYLSLVRGHRLFNANLEDSARIRNVGTVENYITFGVYDGEEGDVSLNYAVYCDSSEGELKVLPRAVKLKTHSLTWKYDGKAHWDKGTGNEEYTADDFITDDGIHETFLDGHTIALTGQSQITNVAESGKYNEFTITIADEYGDSTGNFTIDYEYGMLYIIPRYLEVSTMGGEREYDGTPLVALPGEFTVTEESEDQLVVGHRLTLATHGASITEKGSVEHLRVDGAEATITAGGEDVTANYVCTYLNGTLTILPRKIVVNTESAEKVYDGTPLTNPKYSVTNLVEGHTVGTITVTGTITEIGETANEFDDTTVIVYDANGKDVTYNYIVEERLGVLKVTGEDDDLLDKSSDIDSESPGEGDPTPLFTVLGDYTGTLYLRETAKGDYGKTKWYGAPVYDDGSGISPLYYGGFAAQNAGRPNHTITVMGNSANLSYMTPYYVASTQSDSTSDVRLPYEWAGDSYELVFYPTTKRTLTVGSLYADLEAAYAEYAQRQYTYLPSDTLEKMLSIAEANGITASSVSVIDDVADFVSNHVPYDLHFTCTYQDDFAVYFFEQATGAICQHYATAATAMYRALGIPARYATGYMVEIEAGMETAVSGLNAHAWVEVYISGMGWVNVEVTGGSAGNGGEDDEEPPEIWGNLYIKPTDILVYGKEDAVLTHSGELEDAMNTGLKDLLLYGHTYQATVAGEQIGPGSSECMIIDFKLFDARGMDVTKYYEIETFPGTLTITDGLFVHVGLYTVTQEYNGEPVSFQPDDEYWIEELSEHFTEADVHFDYTAVPSLTEAGELSHEQLLLGLTVTLNGEDVTSACEVVFTGGLEVTRRMITLKASSAKKEYDGKPLTSSVVYITNGSLVTGHELIATTSGSITSEGSEVNAIANYKIVDANGNDVTANYLVKTQGGTLTVTAG